MSIIFLFKVCHGREYSFSSVRLKRMSMPYPGASIRAQSSRLESTVPQRKEESMTGLLKETKIIDFGYSCFPHLLCRIPYDTGKHYGSAFLLQDKKNKGAIYPYFRNFKPFTGKHGRSHTGNCGSLRSPLAAFH